MDKQIFIRNIFDIFGRGKVTRYELETLVDRFENTTRQDQKEKDITKLENFANRNPTELPLSFHDIQLLIL